MSALCRGYDCGIWPRSLNSDFVDFLDFGLGGREWDPIGGWLDFHWYAFSDSGPVVLI